MKNARPLPLQLAALGLACLRGIGEFASLQRWRWRERFGRQPRHG